MDMIRDKIIAPKIRIGRKVNNDAKVTRNDVLVSFLSLKPATP